MKRKSVLSAFLLCIFCVSLSAPIASATPLIEPYETGPYAIGHTSFTVADPSGRLDIFGKPYTLFVEVFYPVDAKDANGPEAVYDFGNGLLATSSDMERAGFPRTLAGPPVSSKGPFPAVIMGGGDFGTRSVDHVYTNFIMASHGFIVLAPARVGMTSFKMVLLDRLKDVSVLIDAIYAKNSDAGDRLHNAINLNSIGVGGWSLGGFVAYGIAGGYTDKFDANDVYDPDNSANETRETILADKRVKAIIALDGSANGFNVLTGDIQENLTKDELATIKIPTLIMGQHRSVIGNSFNLRPHEQISSKANYLVEIEGSRHGSFGSIICGGIILLQANPEADMLYGSPYGVPLSSIMLLQDPECGTAPDPIQTGVNYIGGKESIRLLNLYMVSFLKRHLEGDERYNRYLNKGYAISNELAVDFYKATQD